MRRGGQSVTRVALHAGRRKNWRVLARQTVGDDKISEGGAPEQASPA